jgi:hypothetical protein
MSAAISPATSQSYGVQRVCRIWDLPRIVNSEFDTANICVVAVATQYRKFDGMPQRQLNRMGWL